MKRLILTFTLIITIVLSMVIFYGCGAEINDIVFGTYYNVKLKGKGSTDIAKSIESELKYFDNIFSAETAGSDIYNINTADAGVAVNVDQHTVNLISLAHKLYNITDKAFNPAAYPLVKLWGFDSKNFSLTKDSIPTEAQISQTLSYCKMELFNVDETNLTVTKSDGRAMLDLGGIAKGYAASRAKSFATEAGLSDVLIDIGGELAIGGTEKKVGIISPFSTAEAYASVNVSNLSLATSGTYERYYMLNNVKYHHIIAKNGYPSGIFDNNPVVSVSVIANDGASADAYATFGIVSGYEVFATTIDKNKISALFIFADKTYKSIGSNAWTTYNV